VILAALKRAEDEDALILRLYEVDGRTSEAEIKFNPGLAGLFVEAVEVDLLERPLDKSTATYSDGTLSVTVPAYGITTVKLVKG